ncbi:MAG: OmpH family outer membrane protein [Flavobacteriaceae bacterium]|jgi:outer membrane protein|nr:OmpH family outer membrane protein [Flavobacteriaceae bacterium]
MKKMKSLLIAAALFFGISTTTVMAQSKVAHIDVQQLMTELPAMKSAEAELKKIGEGYEKEFSGMMTEYQNKIKKYQDEAAKAGDAENEKRAKEVDELQQRIQKFQTTAQQDLQKKQLDLTQPIFEKARTAIQKVAKAKGFEYVLDSSMGSGVLLADGTNLLADVKKELGVTK